MQDLRASLARRMRVAPKGNIFHTCEACVAASVLHPTHLWCVGALFFIAGLYPRWSEFHFLRAYPTPEVTGIARWRI